MSPGRAARGQSARPPLVAQGRHLRVELSPDDGHLVSLVDRASGRELLAAVPETTSLWSLQLRDGGTMRTLTARAAGRFRATPATARGDALQLTWDRFAVAASPRLAVTATVRVAGATADSEWRIRVDGMDAGGIDSVRFPRISGIASVGPGGELAVPLWMGQRARDPRRVLRNADGGSRRLEWFYPGQLSLQALALYPAGGTGLYLAADDSLAYRKSFALWGEGTEGAGYEMVHLPENPARATRYAPSYAAIVGAVTGDWLTAAERYRAWGTRQAWARRSRLERGLVPRWVTETGIWIWNRGRSPGVLDPALALQREYALPVSVFWHWWHKGAYDTSFPDYLPPREGREPFRAAVKAAQSQGVHAIVYMNQRLWCLDTPSWTREGAERFAVRNPDGSFRTEVYNIFDPKPCATMDIATPFWRDKYAGIAEEVVRDYGLDGIYMDQAVLSLVCWSPDHGHPVGGGHYWMDGFRALARDIRRRAPAARPVTLGGEGGGESWLPELDDFLTLQVSTERYADPGGGWEVIPFFQAVYHRYALTYGSYSSLTFPPYDDLWPAEFAPANALTLLDPKFRRQFHLEQARAFVWGMQPTIANFLPEQLRERRTDIDYALQLAKIRRALPDFFLRGTFVRAPSSDAPLVDVPISRVSIYAARRGGATETARREPVVQLGAFRARDGRVAIAVASILEEPLSVTLDVHPAALGLTNGARAVRVDAGGRRSIGALSANASPLTLQLSPLQAAVLLLEPR